LAPELRGTIYKGMFSDTCLLFSASNFPTLIASPEGTWLLWSTKLVPSFAYKKFRMVKATAPHCR
jgi:hypothetical protein